MKQRHFVWLGVTLALLSGSSASAGVVDNLRLPESIPGLVMPERSYDVRKPEPVNSSWARGGHRPIGINLSNYELTAIQIEAVRQTGCGLVRLNIPFEPFHAALDDDGRPQTDVNENWLALDQVVSRLGRAGLEVLPTLTASVVPEVGDFQRFCNAIAQRYGPTFNYYQILDNINYFRGLPSQEYADLLSSARLSIITADPGAKIVAGGIRGCDLTYLDLLEQNAAMPFVDILAFSIYPPVDGIETISSRSMWMHSLPLFEQAVEWAAQRGKAVWVTTLGVPTSYGDAQGLGVDQVTQASMYARSAILLGYLGAERIIIASIQDNDPFYVYPAQCCGILDVGGAPKASYFALMQLAQLVDGAQQVVPGFAVDQRIFQRLSEADLFDAAGRGTIESGDPLAEFAVKGRPVYAFWLYNPRQQEYRMVYWLGSDPSTEFLISVSLFDPELLALDVRQLLDNSASPLRQLAARNMASVLYQPLSAVPTVIRFKVGRNGSA